MENLRRRMERFFLKNRNRGIPNLMLYIAIGNAIVYLLTVIDPSRVVYSLLRFSPSAIRSGQVWRLFSYVLTYLVDASGGALLISGDVLLGAVSLFCYYQFGKILESHWGSFRFNMYYLTGLVMTDIVALLLGASVSSSALNLSLFLAVATIAPDARVLLMFIIPLRFKYLAWFYLAVTALDVVLSILGSGLLSFYWILALVPLANYFLFFGKDIGNLFPQSWKRRAARPSRPHARPNAAWADSYRSRSGERPYRHKCTVCGRTDTEYPGLEFRYCSKCNGYYCYCIDHINDHAHIQ